MAHEIKLGELITDPGQKRDAVHIAVAPVIAAVKLFPGQDIGLVGSNSAGIMDKPIGIVDPFLKKPVFPGDHFFMFLYPQTITSLRHDWTHPAFESVAPNVVPNFVIAPNVPLSDTYQFTKSHQLAENMRLTEKAKAAQEWLTGYARDLDMDYQELMDAAAKWLRYGDYHTFGIDTPDLVYTNNDAFWEKYEIVTGKVIDSDHKRAFFSCSC